MHTAKSLKKHYTIFSYNKENFKYIYIYVLACILHLITSLLKSRELSQNFKNSKKNYFVFFEYQGLRIYT